MDRFLCRGECIFFGLVLFLIFSTARGVESNLLTDEKKQIILAGEEKTMNGQWGRAFQMFENYNLQWPDDPAGYLFRAAVQMSEMTDCEENLYDEQFHNLCDSIELSAHKYMDNCSPRDSALCFLYLGHQNAYRAMWEVRFGSVFSGMSYGIKAKNRYETGLEIDSTLYDLYLGLGTFHYWKSAKAGILRMTGILKDERERGINELRLAIDSSQITSDAARSALIWVMENEGYYDSVIIYSERMIKKYPGGNSFLWPLGKAHFEKGEYEEAAEVYSKLLNRLKESPGNYYNVIEITYKLYKTCDALDKDRQQKEVVGYLASVSDEIPRTIKRKQRVKLCRILGRGRY